MDPQSPPAGGPLTGSGLLQDRLRVMAQLREAAVAGAVEQVLERVPTWAGRLSGATTTRLYLVSKRGEVTLRAAGATPGDGPTPGARAVIRRVATSGESVMLSPEDHEDTGWPGPAGAFVILVPFGIRARVIGVIQAVRLGQDGGLTQDQLREVRQLGALVGLALEARLRPGTLLLDMLSLERRRSRTLARLGALDSATVDPGELPRQVFDTLARTAVDFTPADACLVQVIDPDFHLRTVGGAGFSEELIVALDAAYAADAPAPASEAVASGATVVMLNARDRIEADPRFGAARELVRTVPWTTETCSPIMGPRGRRGALCCYFAPDKLASATELRLLRAVAAQAASVLDNAPQIAAANRRAARDERLKLARDLHETVSQSLYGIALGARTALENLAAEPTLAREPMDYVLELAEKAIAEIRGLIFDLRPHTVETQGLGAALLHLAEAVRLHRGVAVETHIEAIPEAAAIDVQLALFRIAEEAINNATRHGKPQVVQLRCAARDESLHLDVVDDGVGFDPRKSRLGHFGLRLMRERAAAVGGTVRLHSSPQEGTHVKATVPLAGMRRERVGRTVRPP